MKYGYKTSGTCSRYIEFDLTDGVVSEVSFQGGCNGNLKAIGKLVEGLKAEEEKDGAAIQVITAKIYQLLNTAPKDLASDYWKYRDYKTWEEIEEGCVFPEAKEVDVFSEDFAMRIRAGWLSQLVGGAMGTQVEGYLTENIRKVFGEVRDYLRAPETYNDDITYEIAFLDAFRKEGYEIETVDLPFTDRYGTKSHYGKYVLVE